MKNTIKALAILAICGFAGTASAQNTASANGYAAGNIIAPVSVRPNENGGGINFGSFVAGSGTVTESGNHITNYSNSQMSPGSNQGSPADASFTVSGQANYSVNLSTAVLGGLPAGLTLSALTVTPGTNPVGLGAGGSVNVTIGGTLTDDGSYTTPGAFNAANAFSLTAAYN